MNRLCALDDIEDGGSAVFYAGPDSAPQGFIVIRQQDTVYIYINSCPHIGTPLDFTPGQFLSPDKNFILCSSHAALFRIEDGYCVSGPCARQKLTAVATTIHGREIFLD